MVGSRKGVERKKDSKGETIYIPVAGKAVMQPHLGLCCSVHSKGVSIGCQQKLRIKLMQQRYDREISLTGELW